MPFPSEKGVGQDSKQTSGPCQFSKNDGLFSVLLSEVGTAQDTFNLSHRARLAYIVIFSTQAFHAKNESDNLRQARQPDTFGKPHTMHKAYGSNRRERVQ